MVNLRIRKSETPGRRITGWPDMSDIEKEIFSNFPMWFGKTAESMGDTWTPSVDIIEKDDSWVFKAELPEVNPDDVHVTVEEGILSIKGSRKFEEEVSEGNYTRFERHYGSFERRFSLPSGIDSENITANYRHGVLTLSVPKKEEAKPKPIKIEVK